MTINLPRSKFPTIMAQIAHAEKETILVLKRLDYLKNMLQQNLCKHWEKLFFKYNIEQNISGMM